ncbi:MAG: AAA family ATPase, partial [Thermoanaerobaculales bacterium]|nr:AAA family ATPase [Thermoanaerobaculales bacterium]
MTRLTEEHGRLTEKFRDVFQEVAEIRRMVQHRVEDLRRKLIQPAFDAAVDRVRRLVKDPGAGAYLDAVAADLGDNLELFMISADDVPGDVDPFLRWRVYLAVDNSDASGRPVVMETEPSYTNLFGTIEREMTSSGETSTSFMHIRAGSMLRANGGFLVLNADDVLMEPRVWPGLKRALKYRRVQIQSMESMVLGAMLLSPEPVPIDVKVVIIGSRNIYDLLFQYDRDFPKIFKVLADFDNLLENSRDHARDLLSVFRKVIDEEELLELDAGGAAALLEEAVRLGGWRRRFSSQFSDLADLLRESSYTAEQDRSKVVSRAHVEQAHAARRRRHSLSEDRSHQFISEGVVTIATSGVVVGQVNGLAVYDLGHHRFGKPSRITAQVGLGREGVINVERQAGLSGPTYDKGVSILTGFLRGTFARRFPLTMSCSVTFEQSYGGIDGDSASSTEIYAILSALSGIGLRQEIAVTGSVDQFGRVQAIGGVNEKIEGYFAVCQALGLKGDEGVLIPKANVRNLMLSDRVRDAVEKGRFHIFPISTIDEGIGVLTGTPAGTLSAKGVYPKGSINRLVVDHLAVLTEKAREANRKKDKDVPQG